MNRKLMLYVLVPMRLLAAVGMVVSPLLLNGCNTIEGAGKDVKAAGQAVENTSKKAQGE